jgi:hypothetical protein
MVEKRMKFARSSISEKYFQSPLQHINMLVWEPATAAPQQTAKECNCAG